MDHKEIKKSILKSQHCQRNWNLQASINKDDLDLIIYSATQCPSKQNIAFYKVHFIQNREIIEQIHEQTRHPSRHPAYETETNSQILANLVVVFEENNFFKQQENDVFRNFESQKILKRDAKSVDILTLSKDKNIAVGIAAGYVNLISNILGYSTGCCSCFDNTNIKKILDLKGDILLLMGIGIKDSNKNRRLHHQLPDFIFSTKPKQPIEYTLR